MLRGSLMPRTQLAAFVAVTLMAPYAVAVVALSDPELEQGITQAREGDFEVALVTLNGAALRLAGQPNRARDLARTYLYLAVTYVGLNQDPLAKASVQAALRTDPNVAITTREFPPKIYALFMAAKSMAVEPEEVVVREQPLRPLGRKQPALNTRPRLQLVVWT
jgi:hypothetical protein